MGNFRVIGVVAAMAASVLAFVPAMSEDAASQTKAADARSGVHGFDFEIGTWRVRQAAAR